MICIRQGEKSGFLNISHRMWDVLLNYALGCVLTLKNPAERSLQLFLLFVRMFGV